MEKIILYTIRIPLEFNAENIAVVELQNLLDKVPDNYELADRNPFIQLHGETQYVTLKLIEKNPDKRKIGFAF